jgi:uncharacterized protein YcfL
MRNETRNETCETERNEMKRNEVYQNKTERNETKWNEIYRNKTKLHYVYFWHTLRGFQNGPIEEQMSVLIKKSNLIIRLSFHSWRDLV